MNIKETRPLYEAKGGNRVFLSLHERLWEHGGAHGRYFMVTRGPEVVPADQKRPDAVVCVAFLANPGEPRRLVLISEFRVAIGRREVSFPAGLIEERDYVGEFSVELAAKRAAVREMREETGLEFEPYFTSPPNLYSSAGMTDESSIIVFGLARGEPHTRGNEAGEDIEIILRDKEGLEGLLQSREHAFSKLAWPLLWAFSTMGWRYFKEKVPGGPPLTEAHDGAHREAHDAFTRDA